jgi:hypothetical protein
MSYKLPETWYLEVNSSNFEMVEKWRDEVKGYPRTTNQTQYLANTGLVYPSPNGLGIQILTHTFEKYVVGKVTTNNAKDYKYLIKLFKKLNIK